jgi:hypothetical protein
MGNIISFEKYDNVRNFENGKLEETRNNLRAKTKMQDVL